MNPIQDEFSVLAVSNADSFGGNTSAEFRSSLGRPIDMKHYEVALLNVDFTDSYRPPEAWENQIRLPVVHSDVPFFNTVRGDDEIVIIQQIVDRFMFYKAWRLMRSFAGALNTHFEANGVDANYSLLLREGRFAGIAELTYRNEHGYRLHIPIQLANLMGFDQNIFESSPNAYKTTRVITEYGAEAIPDGTAFPIERIKDKKVSARIPQLIGNPALEDIAQSLILAIDSIESPVVTAGAEPTKDFSFSAIVDDEHSALRVNLRPSNATLFLSPFLLNYLGLESNYQFRGRDTILVPKAIVNPELPIQDYLTKGQFLSSVSCSKILVKCNVVEPTHFFKENLVNSIAILDRQEGFKKQFKVHIKNPIYFKCANSTFNYLSFSLVDDTLTLLEEQEFPTVVHLHFRKRIAW